MGPSTSISSILVISILSSIPYSACRPTNPISSLSVTSHITLRFAQTEVEAFIKNPGNIAQEEEFSMFLPDSAFISFFSMTTGEDEKVAKVMAKEKAVEEFNNARKLGIGAGIVSENERDSNKFSIKTSIEPGQKVVFKLKYEELLQRRNGQYEHAININPESNVENLKVEVFINESLPISNLFVPELKHSNELDFNRQAKNKDAVITHKEGTKEAHIEYSPHNNARNKDEESVSGQFLVRYDVDRKGQDSEVQVIDGYFVHFFAPENLQKLPKHAVFVLDISGSMMGEKIVQLKDAMFTILDDMTESDYFSIIVFSSGVNTWTSDKLENLEKDKSEAPVVIQATKHNKKVAIDYVNNLEEGGSTNINDAMIEGIKLAETATKEELLPRSTKSMLIFLTDGQPTVGVRNREDIRKNVRDRNTNKIPIFGLAFGSDSDFTLMKDVSLDADSFAKRIYEGSDAAIQLEDFFSQISNPIISELKFEYLGEVVDNSSVSKAALNSFFKGGEYVVVGKLNNNWDEKENKLSIVLLGEQLEGKYEKKIDICLRPRALPALSDPFDEESHHTLNCVAPPQYPERSAEQNFMQKLHAFVNIKQLLKKDDSDVVGGETPRSKALRLALDNNFVTELTSLVVVNKQEVSVASLGDRDYPFFDSSMIAYSIPSQPQSYGGLSAHSLSPHSGISFGLSAQSAFPTRRNMQGRRRAGAGAMRGGGGGSNFGSSNKPWLITKSYVDQSDSTHHTCSGSLTLYSKTYLRGEKVVISEDTEDLETQQFTDQLVSLSVTGDCCWEVFTGVNYTGDSEQFTSSEKYLSTTSVGQVFRNAKSVKKC